MHRIFALTLFIGACQVSHPPLQGIEMDASVDASRDVFSDTAFDAEFPDTSRPDVSTPDTSVPDTSAADTSIPDVSIPDVSMPDSAPECDESLCVTVPGCGMQTCQAGACATSPEREGTLCDPGAAECGGRCGDSCVAFGCPGSLRAEEHSSAPPVAEALVREEERCLSGQAMTGANLRYERAASLVVIAGQQGSCAVAAFERNPGTATGSLAPFGATSTLGWTPGMEGDEPSEENCPPGEFVVGLGSTDRPHIVCAKLNISWDEDTVSVRREAAHIFSGGTSFVALGMCPEDSVATGTYATRFLDGLRCTALIPGR